MTGLVEQKRVKSAVQPGGSDWFSEKPSANSPPFFFEEKKVREMKWHVV